MPYPSIFSQLPNAARMMQVFGPAMRPTLASRRTGASIPSPTGMRTASVNAGIPKTLGTPSFSFTPPDAPAVPAKMSTVEKIQQGAESLVPFASNIANSFRRPVQPPVPKSVNPVRFRKVNFSGMKAEADREVEGMNQGLNYLPENQATAVRTANAIQGIRAKNMYTTQEEIQNAQIANQEAQVNANIDQYNTGMYNQWQDQKADMNMAHQAQQSANLSNAADKYIGIQNENKRMDLERTKYAILQNLYKPSGVLQRFTDDMKVDPKTGLPTYRFGGKLKYRAGGMMKVYGGGGELTPNGGGKPVPNTSRTPQSQTLEVDRAVDAFVVSDRGTLLNNNTQLNIAPRPAQTAEAARSGDYFAPPAANHQYVTFRSKPQPVVTSPVNSYAAVKYSRGGSLRKVY